MHPIAIKVKWNRADTRTTYWLTSCLTFVAYFGPRKQHLKMGYRCGVSEAYPERAFSHCPQYIAIASRGKGLVWPAPPLSVNKLTAGIDSPAADGSGVAHCRPQPLNVFVTENRIRQRHAALKRPPGSICDRRSSSEAIQTDELSAILTGQWCHGPAPAPVRRAWVDSLCSVQ